jgi:DNA mismatch endonuclease, patch repair protein
MNQMERKSKTDRRTKHQRRLSAPSFRGFRPSSGRASHAARAASAKSGSRCERAVQRVLDSLDLNYRVHVIELFGCPDFVVDDLRLLIFVDGDFWHGRNLKDRIERLGKGWNGEYWVQKIQSNVARDQRNRTRLRRAGWSVIRVWELDVLKRERSQRRRLIRLIARRRSTLPDQSKS